MPTVIMAIANQKGGVGKTTTAINLACGLAHEGHKTLLIDFDSQGSASLALGLGRGPGIRRLLLAQEPLPSVLQPTRENLDMVTSNDALADIRDWLITVRGRNAETAIRALAEALKDYIAPYKFVLIDCGPGLDILTINALTAATAILVPVSPDFLSAEGTKQHLEISMSMYNLGKRAHLKYIVPTMYDVRLRRCREYYHMLLDAFGAMVTDPIRENTYLAEAPYYGQSIFEYDPSSLGAADYDKLTRRVIYDYR